MFAFQVAEIFLKALILCGLLYLFARQEADVDFRKVAMVTAGITLGNILLEFFLTPYIGVFVLLPMLGFVIFMLTQFCWVSFKRALIVALPFLAINLGLAYGVNLIKQKVNASMDQSIARTGVSDQDMREVMAFYKHTTDSAGNSAGVGAVPLPDSDLPMDDIVSPIHQMPAGVLPGSSSNSTPDDVEPHAAEPVVVTESVPAPPPPAATNAVAVSMPAQRDPEPVLMKPVTPPTLRPVDALSPDWTAAKKKLKVKAVMAGRNGRLVASVNSRMVEVGDNVSVDHDGKLYIWKATAITKDNVLWVPDTIRPAK